MTANVRSATLALLASISLAACSGAGQSRLNPFNWFGTSSETTTTDDASEAALTSDERPLVQQITALVIEQTPGGAIIRATALPPTQGWYAPELVNEDPDGEPIDGALLFTFRAEPPLSPQPVSTVQSRELSAAVFVSSIALSRVSQIQVSGATNARSARR